MKRDICDLKIEAEWAGTADVDLEVVEPDGSVCDRKSQITKNGGLIAQTADGGKKRQKEEYRCLNAPVGDYQAVVRLIRGRVITGRVRLRVTRYQGTDRERTETIQVPVGNSDARVKVTLRRGRRVESPNK